MRQRLPRWAKTFAGMLVECLQRLDPTRFFDPRAVAPFGSVAFLCIYRKPNAPVVRALLDQLPEGAVVRLWALDAVDDGLRPLTVGCGRGGRLDLLNRLATTIDDHGCDLLIVADDDLCFHVGELQKLLRLGTWLGFDAFQPAHSRRSEHSYRLTRKRWLSVGRRTTFVEQGPLLVLARPAQRHLLPMPDGFGMGWGVEVRWAQLSSQLVFGIVDAVAVRHLHAGEHSYDTTSEAARLASELAEIGVDRVQDLQRDVLRHHLPGAVLHRGPPAGARPTAAG